MAARVLQKDAQDLPDRGSSSGGRQVRFDQRFGVDHEHGLSRVAVDGVDRRFVTHPARDPGHARQPVLQRGQGELHVVQRLAIIRVEALRFTQVLHVRGERRGRVAEIVDEEREEMRVRGRLLMVHDVRSSSRMSAAGSISTVSVKGSSRSAMEC